MNADFIRPKIPDFHKMSDDETDRYVDQFDGVFFAIPLDGEYAFGRVLPHAVVACYDLKSPKICPIDEIEKASIFFYSTGGIRAVMGGRRWKILGKKPLTGELARPAKFFRLHVPTGAVDIYCDRKYQPYDGEDLSRIPRLCITNARHVVEHVKHHFAGTENPRGSIARYDPNECRVERLEARAQLAKGTAVFPDWIVQFLNKTTEEMLDSFSLKPREKRG